MHRIYICLDAVVNNLLIYALPSGELGNTTGNLQPPPQPSCRISNFPLQSWVNIAVSVYNRAIDVYMDGKLQRSCVLAGTPMFPEDGINTLTLGFAGGGSCRVWLVALRS